MEMKFELKDFEKVVGKFENVPYAAKNAVIDELVIAATDLRNEMITSMRDSPPIGYVYRRGNRKHIASAPGYPPRRDSGDLVNSLEMDVDEMNIQVEVGSLITDPPYPKFLEEGVGDPSDVYYIAPRPFMQPAMDKLEKNIEGNVMNAIIESIGSL